MQEEFSLWCEGADDVGLGGVELKRFLVLFSVHAGICEIEASGAAFEDEGKYLALAEVFAGLGC